MILGNYDPSKTWNLELQNLHKQQPGTFQNLQKFDFSEPRNLKPLKSCFLETSKTSFLET
jgi:hypothetical protein